MSTAPGTYVSMGQTYSNQQTSLVFNGYSYVYSASTLSVQPYTLSGANCYLQVTANPNNITINVGDHIVGPNIPVETIVLASLDNNVYQVSKTQSQGGAAVSAYVCTGTATQYGKIVSSAPTYATSAYRGKLDIYAPTNTNTNPLMVLTNGNVAIGQGKSAPLSTLDVSGSVIISGNLAIGKTTVGASYAVDISGLAYATGFVSSSDYRIKTNVVPILGIRTIDVLRPVEYDLAGRHDMGFLAHEVQESFPFLVTGDKDGEQTQSLNYTGLIALLVKEIQEIKRELAIQKQNHSNI